MTDAKGWDRYWQSQQNVQALAVQTGYSDPLEQHWQAFFNRVLHRYVSLRYWSWPAVMAL